MSSIQARITPISSAPGPDPANTSGVRPDSLSYLAAIAHTYDRYAHPPKIEGVSEPFTRCGYGRGANCVIDGETIRVGGDTLKIAGMRAPRIRSARCDAEEQRGVKAVEELTALLNSGKVTTGDQVREPDGQTRTEVLVNGQDVAAAMIAASAAREAGSIPPSWC